MMGQVAPRLVGAGADQHPIDWVLMADQHRRRMVTSCLRTNLPLGPRPAGSIGRLWPTHPASATNPAQSSCVSSYQVRWER